MARDKWTPTRFGDLASVTHGWPFKSELFSEELTGKPIIVSIGNFRYTGGFRFESTTTKEYRGEYPKSYELKPSDTLLVMTCQTSGGEILGIPARVPDDGRIYLHNQRMGKIVIKDENRFDAAYAYWLCLWQKFNHHLATSASGTKILHTSPGRIEDFQFDLPPLPTQRAIAGVLGALDDKIEVNRRMARTLEAAARALFESWFVRFEHPGGKAPAPRLVESSMGSIPEGWTVRPLDTIARFLNGLALQKFPPKDGEPTLPVIKIAQLRKGDTVGADQANTEIAADYVVSDGDMLFSWSGSLECVLWTGGPGALNQHLFKVTSTEFPQWFVYLWVQQHLPEFRHIAAAKATTMGHIQRHHLTNALVAVPPAKVLAEMGRTLGPMIEAIPYRMIEARTLAAMRDSLLPRVISGELEIPAAMLKEAAR
jgi:type I restriction enzyme S subunit